MILVLVNFRVFSFIGFTSFSVNFLVIKVFQISVITCSVITDTEIAGFVTAEILRNLTFYIQLR
jgi:hypothetical protein